MDSIKLPPQNVEAERAVIGAILIDSETISKVADILIPEYFYDPKHEIIFGAIMNLYHSSKAIDVLTLSDELKHINKLNQVGGIDYLSEIVSSVPTSSNAKDYALIVKEKAIRRKLISYSSELTEKARTENNSIDELLDDVEKNLLNLSTTSAEKDFWDAGSLVELQMERADEFAKNPNALRGTGTGFRDLDRILGGLQNSDLIILAARPSIGKSAFSIDIARHAAVNEKKTVAIFSLEMPAVQIMERMLAQQLGVNLWNIRMGKMTDDDFKKYSSGAGKISESKIFIDDTSGVTIHQLRTKARKLAMEQGLDMLIVDYLQLMQTRETDNRAFAVGEISRSLKILARELNIPIIALSQLNRSVENRSDNIPQLSDLRESGSIEQDADLVMFLSKDISLDEQTEAEIYKIYVTIAKHRNGSVGQVALNFKPVHQKFTDI